MIFALTVVAALACWLAARHLHLLLHPQPLTEEDIPMKKILLTASLIVLAAPTLGASTEPTEPPDVVLFCRSYYVGGFYDDATVRIWGTQHLLSWTNRGQTQVFPADITPSRVTFSGGAIDRVSGQASGDFGNPASLQTGGSCSVISAKPLF
jgi:hypothetical protein